MRPSKQTRDRFIKELKKKNIDKESIHKEWSAAKNSNDGLTNSYYSPRVDIAVEPFNIGSDYRDKNKIEEKCNYILGQINLKFRNGVKTNPNPRCFLAIEVVFSGSRKHLLGDILNASILGGIGIIVSKDSLYEPLIKIKEYLNFAARNRKGDIDALPKNLIIIKESEIDSFFIS